MKESLSICFSLCSMNISVIFCGLFVACMSNTLFFHQLQEKEARRFFQQIISGVDYCHRHMVVHRYKYNDLIICITMYCIFV